jgi:hypothetical protein
MIAGAVAMTLVREAASKIVSSVICSFLRLHCPASEWGVVGLAVPFEPKDAAGKSIVGDGETDRGIHLAQFLGEERFGSECGGRECGAEEDKDGADHGGGP